MTEYLRETWDLHAIAAVAMVCLVLLLLWVGAAVTPLLAVSIVVLGTLCSVLCVVWMLHIAGGSLPW